MGGILRTLYAACIAHILFFCSESSGIITQKTNSLDLETATENGVALLPHLVTGDANGTKNPMLTTLREELHDSVTVTLDSSMKMVPSAHCSGKEVEECDPSRENCASKVENNNGTDIPLVLSATGYSCDGNKQQLHSDKGAGSVICNLKNKALPLAARGYQGRACCVTNANNLKDTTCRDAGASCGMAAYFENSCQATILFHFWRTTTVLNYTVTLIIIFLLSLFTVMLKALRKKANTALTNMNTCPYVLRQLAMFVIAYAVILMDFCMMLVVMTFNVGIVLVACTGYALGYLLTCFRPTSSTNVAESESPIECDADCC
ncbi:hypothetical protein, conserved [Babesia bigemina]|uniref:Copper transport protein n=1 Tax=Babesia bigemina TaxID=5866 RepID=A0A061D900_BABBI|nr:hypothetical protein, conserved [Babesia bigemina]CDR94210.1 hypothetical protein, conserved [Babesia bigemina]|eukprot:XP_012766396.1 hypothetical protein, conserved [Babesia bigemina]